jgi:hypothetical protein
LVNYRLFAHRDLKGAIWGKICQSILRLSGGLLAHATHATPMGEMKSSKALCDSLPSSRSMRTVRSATMPVHRN